MNEITEIVSKLLAAWSEHDEQAAREAAVAELASAEGVKLDELRDAVVAQFDAVHGKDAYDEADMAAMAALVHASNVIQERLETDAEREAAVSGFADTIARVKEKAQEPSSAPEGEQANAEDAPAAEAAQEAVQEPAAPVEGSTGSTGGTNDINAEADAASGSADKELEPVAASAASGATTPARVPLGGHDKVTGPGGRSTSRYTTVAAVDVPGFAAGQVLNGIEDVAHAAVERLQALSRGGVSGSQRLGIASIKRESTYSTNDYDGASVYDLVEQATNERQLPEGNLIAAGGWCAPSETLYDMCPIADASAGMWDVPEIQARRGGIRFPNVPDFSDIYSAVGFHLTETQVAAGTKKSCYEIPCTDYTECRMDVDGLCIKSPILTERAWPELVRYFTQQALAAHAHKLNAYKLATAAAAATAVTITAGADPTKDAYGPGATATLLGLLELQVEYYRYKYRLSQNATLEGVMPHWALGILRSDLAKRNGVDMLNISDAQLKAYMSARGVRMQFVYDWQDALATGTDTDFGGATNPTTWPATVDVLLYPAGTYFALTSPVITIDGLYDSSLLEINMHLALFTEEGIAVCKRCYQATKLTIPLCANGTTGEQVRIACPAA